MSEVVQVLILPCHQDDPARVREALRQAGYESLITCVTTFDALRKQVDLASWDLLLAGHRLCESGLAALVYLARARQPRLPIVLLSDSSASPAAAAAVRTGAHDVLGHDELHRLALVLAQRHLPNGGSEELQEETQRSEEANDRSLFEDSPISLWVEDFSDIKACTDQLRASGVTDFRTYLLEHPEVVRHCMSRVKVLDVNRRSVQLYEASSRKELMDSLAKVAGEWTFDAYRDSIAAVAEGETRHEMEVLNRTLTGKDLHVSSRWSVAPGHEQTYSRVTFSIIDITARRHVEQALRENQRMLATLMSNLPGMAYRCRNDCDWTMEFVSDGCLQLTGYHPSDLVGNRSTAFAQIMHPEDREGVWSQIQAALHEQRPYRLIYRICTAGGQLKWVWEQGRGVYTPDGEVLALEGFTTDISERQQAEEAMRERASLRELSHRIISSQEEERRRLSRELHDEAGQALTAIKINTELLTKRIPDNLMSLKQLASDTTELTTGLISEMRRIAVALRPAVLEDLGLLPTLRWYTKSVEMRYGLRVKLISRGLKGRLEQSFETTIYRIVQEALTNVVRHAQARHVVVKVACGKHGLDLAVSDDGKGMDVASIQRGTGLTGIRERAHLFSGTMSLESQAGVGTTLQIRFSVIPEAAS